MRKFIPVYLLALFTLLSLSSCGNSAKDGEKPAAGSGGSGGSLLSFSREFEGILTMRTTIPEAGSTETRMFIAKEGVRMETKSDIKNMPAGMQMVILSPSETPNLVYMLNESNSTYTVIDTDEMQDAAEKEGYSDLYKDAKIENLGKETVNGYSCTHIRISQGDQVSDMWVSKDVLDYATFARMQSTRDKDMPEFAKKMKAAGYDGFPVKMVQSPSNITTELVKVEKKGLDAALFAVPAGYTKTELPTMNYNISPGQREKMEAAMKKMQERMGTQQGQ
ncbi:MAG: DUF4412 domain-containing protein [Chlorobium sp.]|uniref:DUF4412 domain-containing protein n=1 Tax=Chlorobium sp. TaxID=1095 RepID=UPI002F40EC4C